MLTAISAWYRSCIASLIAWYLGALKTIGYPVVVLLMAIESSILPLPSEVVIPPAAHLAHTGQIPLSLWGIVLAGTIGSCIRSCCDTASTPSSPATAQSVRREWDVRCYPARARSQ